MIAPSGLNRKEIPSEAQAMICPRAGLSEASGPKYWTERMRPAACA